MGQSIQHRGLFKFYNVIAKHAYFPGVVLDVWQNRYSSNLLEDIWIKCKKLKNPMKQINTQWFVRTSEKVGKLREKLEMVQK